MSLTMICPEVHVVRETPASVLFRRLLNFPDIFTFFNVITGEWCLAWWVNKLGRVAEELEDLGPAFEKVTPELVHQIRTCWKPVDWKKKKQYYQSRQKDRMTRANEKLIQDVERWNWLKKKTAHKGPVPYAFIPPRSTE